MLEYVVGHVLIQVPLSEPVAHRTGPFAAVEQLLDPLLAADEASVGIRCHLSHLCPLVGQDLLRLLGVEEDGRVLAHLLLACRRQVDDLLVAYCDLGGGLIRREVTLGQHVPVAQRRIPGIPDPLRHERELGQLQQVRIQRVRALRLHAIISGATGIGVNLAAVHQVDEPAQLVELGVVGVVAGVEDEIDGAVGQ